MASIVLPEKLTSPVDGNSFQGDEGELLCPPTSWFSNDSDNEDVDELPDNDCESVAESLEQPQIEHATTNNNPGDENRADEFAFLEESKGSTPVSLKPENPPTVGRTRPAPSWREISSDVLPAAARELLSSTMNRIQHTARLSYVRARWHRKYSELGNVGGYFRTVTVDVTTPELPLFSSLSWIDRQMVAEWRTYLEDSKEEAQREEDVDFERARTLFPSPVIRPKWEQAEVCHTCLKTFGPTRLRHHCRLCGNSFCRIHSAESHCLPHLGYEPDVPERVCDGCKRLLLNHNLAERVAWRLARCRDHSNDNLAPYFETGVDTFEQIAQRIADAALQAAKSIPLGAQATVAVETVDVFRKYGLNGIYTIMLRQEFLAAADLLRKALGINQTAWPLSVHELTAAIFYALAQYRAMRGLYPEHEHHIHSFQQPTLSQQTGLSPLGAESEEGSEKLYSKQSAESLAPDFQRNDNTVPNDGKKPGSRFEPVCFPVPDAELDALIFYSPIALNFIYAEKEVDMQLLAAQQGWRLLYSYLKPIGLQPGYDMPASALFVHDEEKILCFACRGTATISDVVTDIRQVAVSFPEADVSERADEEWTKVRRGQGVAVCGMSNAALNLYQEHIDSLLHFAKRGYRIRLTGHSLGGGVSALLGVLLHRDLVKMSIMDPIEKNSCVLLEKDAVLKVYAYGTPSCVDMSLSTFMEAFVTSVVLHDDVVPRMTPSSCRGLLKYLLHIRETWVKDHLPDDLQAISNRAKLAWAPRWRGGFVLPTSSVKRYCRKQLQNGQKKLQSMKGILCDEWGQPSDASHLPYSRDVEEPSDGQLEDQEPPGGRLIDVLGTETAGGLVVGDDIFFDPGESLIEDEDEAVFFENTSRVVAHSPGMQAAENDECDSPGAVVLEETPLPRMFQPGRIVHVYSHRGVYKAAYVPRDFRELRRISLAGNMLTDHKAKPYYEGLLEVRSVRRAQEAPPRWTAFDEDDTCSCCASKFTWASTCDSKAQEARDKHNCRSCGTLVCDPCSSNRIALPSIGLNVPARCCDRCYNDIDGILTGNARVENERNPLHTPTRQRQRRSHVVDDLVARVHTAPLQRASKTS